MEVFLIKSWIWIVHTKGVLVNSIPQILKTVKGVIDSIVDFVTPIQSAFSLIIDFFQGDFDTKKYDVDKKRVDDSFKPDKW